MFEISVKESSIEYSRGDAEKMDSLNSLSKGISHFLNTPLGIGITASSHNSSIIKDLCSEIDNPECDIDHFKSKLEVLFQSNELVLRNLKKSAGIISKLKNTVVVTRDAMNREQNLSKLIDEILRCLNNEFGKRLDHITLEAEIPSDIFVHFGVNTLWEVLKHLIENSIVHGFSHNSAGNIKIGALSSSDEITITYSDNGAGFEEKSLERIFEPFYTTKCDSSYAGLGMTAVYNIVTQCMNGQIECRSGNTGGMEVLIRIDR